MNDIIKQGNATNQWGVCGFVSVLNALHQEGKLQSFGRTLNIDEIQQRLGAEIITYLKMTAIGRPGIANSILTYTQSFGAPYSGYKSINDICNRIASEVRKAHNPGDWTNFQGGIGVAMPASAVQDYVEFVGLKSTLPAVNNAPFTKSELVKYRDCIVGCGREPRTDPENGLRHWVYIDKNGCLLNWGVKTDLNTSSLPQAVIDKKYGYIPAVIQLQ
jgi:hypothetical protein